MTATPSAGTSRRTTAVLELVRLPNLPTAAADVLAGFLYMGGRCQDLDVLVPLLGASVSLYAGGVALNDVCDASLDRIERPERPIPSGRISQRTGATTAAILLGIGIPLATLASARAGAIAGVLTGLILLYNWVLKETAFGPWVLGLCRAANLSLGLSVHPTYRTLAAVAPLVVLITIYTASIGVFARDEATTSRRGRLIRGTLGVAVSTALLSLIPFLVPDGRRSAIPFALLMAMLHGVQGWRAARTGVPMDVQRSTAGFIAGLIGFDAAIAWAARGIGAGALVAGLLIPTLLLRKRFRMS